MNTEQRVQKALEDLHDPDFRKRSAAFDVLAELKALRALPDLIGFLFSSDWAMQMKAAQVLGEIGDARVAPEVAELLASDEHLVVREAVIALGKLKSVDAVPDLIKVLRCEALCALFEKERGHANSFENSVALAQFAVEISSLRTAAAGALGQIRDPRAVPALIEAMRDEHITSGNNEIAALALEQIGTEEALAALQEYSWGEGA